MKKKIAFWRNVLLISLLTQLTIFGFAQNNFPVTGKITDNAGKPLEGVTIQVKGTSITTITRADGSFSINAPSGSSVLVFSSVGFNSQEIPIKNKGQLNLSLANADDTMDQVVVIGYGTVRKRDLTGAVSSISEKDIKSRPVDNALQAMQGKVAGVDISTTDRPGTVPSITIRGLRSLTASNAPLFVVDGVTLATGGIEFINPNDIESIDVLKDASSTAIYGARGANGVVIVTTKQGKTGRTNLNLNYATTFETIVDKQEMFNAEEYITFRRWAYYYKNPATYPRGDQPTIANDKVIFLATSDPSAWANIAKGWASGTWDGSKVQTTDWRGLVSQTGITHNVSVGVSGGSDKIKSYASFGYLDNKGTQRGQSFIRYSGLSNIDINATRWFSMGTNLNVSYSIQEFGQSNTGRTTVSSSNTLYESARALFPYAVPYDSAGNRIFYPGGDVSWKNVVNEWNLNQDQRTTLRAFGSFYGQIDFGAIHPVLKGLKYKANFGPDFSFYRDGTYIDPNSVISSGASSASLRKTQTYSYTMDHLIYYNRSVGRHDFGLTLLGTQTKYKQETNFISAKNIPFESQRWNALSKNYIPAANLLDYSSDLTERQLQSYMGRINYTFNDKYLLQAAVRRDGASQLAEGHKYSWFPAASIAWRMSREDFMRDARWVNDLKLRFGYGSSGNYAIREYATLGGLTSVFYPFGTTLTPGAIPSTTLPNQLLGWEKTAQYNIGIDFSLLNRRISGTLDLYKSSTTDLLQQQALPLVTGFPNTFANVAETAAKGIDLSLTTANISTRSFNWTTTLTAAYQKDKIISVSGGKQDDIVNGWFIGNPQDVIYGYRGAGIWHLEDSATYKLFNAKGASFSTGSARPVDINGDTSIDANHDRVIIGYTRPKWIVGMTNTFSYKSLELSVFLYGRLKYMVNTGGEGQSARGVQREISYYNENNKNSEYQKPIYSEGSGDPYSGVLGYRNASFIKIRNISLGYTLDNRVLKTNAISGIKVYVQVVNPGTLFSKIGWRDMDVNGPTYNRGITVGLNATF
jgi:TonB-dependent starch-binding outer membrane protein SusC